MVIKWENLFYKPCRCTGGPQWPQKALPTVKSGTIKEETQNEVALVLATVSTSFKPPGPPPTKGPLPLMGSFQTKLERTLKDIPP